VHRPAGWSHDTRVIYELTDHCVQRVEEREKQLITFVLENISLYDNTSWKQN